MEEFRLPERSVNLVLDDSDYQDARITVRTSIPLSAYIEADAVVTEMRANPRDMASLNKAIAFFVTSGLISWNLADRNGPVPQTADGMRDHLDPVLIGTIVAAWLGQIGGVPSPLAKRSPSGDTSKAPPASKSPRRSRKPNSSTPSAAAGPATP